MNVVAVVVLLLFAGAGIALTTSARTRKVGIPILVSSIGVFIVLSVHVRGLRVGFESLRVGDPLQDVVTVLGDPSIATDGTLSVYGSERDSRDVPAGCVKEYWYKSVLTPEKWAICFDSSERVVALHQYLSY